MTAESRLVCQPIPDARRRVEQIRTHVEDHQGAHR